MSAMTKKKQMSTISKKKPVSKGKAINATRSKPVAVGNKITKPISDANEVAKPVGAGNGTEKPVAASNKITKPVSGAPNTTKPMSDLAKPISASNEIIKPVHSDANVEKVVNNSHDTVKSKDKGNSKEKAVKATVKSIISNITARITAKLTTTKAIVKAEIVTLLFLLAVVASAGFLYRFYATPYGIKVLKKNSVKQNNRQQDSFEQRIIARDSAKQNSFEQQHRDGTIKSQEGAATVTVQTSAQPNYPATTGAAADGAAAAISAAVASSIAIDKAEINRIYDHFSNLMHENSKKQQKSYGMLLAYLKLYSDISNGRPFASSLNLCMRLMPGSIVRKLQAIATTCTTNIVYSLAQLKDSFDHIDMFDNRGSNPSFLQRFFSLTKNSHEFTTREQISHLLYLGNLSDALEVLQKTSANISLTATGMKWLAEARKTVELQEQLIAIEAELLALLTQ